MDYPELFYGVNLERIPKRRMRFTKGILVGEYRVDVNELRFIASKQELEIFLSDEEGSEGVRDFDVVHIGQLIRSTYVYENKIGGKKRFSEECAFFDINQILRLRQNPSRLIDKLKRVGLIVKPKELCLYGISCVD